MKKRKLRIPAILAAAGVCAVLAASPAFAGEWHKDGKVWRYTDDSGRGVNSGWVQDNGSWYFLEPDSTGAGAMKTGWVKDGDTWYYLSPDGAQSTGWQSIGGAWYYFDPAEGGAMAFNRKIGDYYINASGIWAEGSGGVNISAGSGSGAKKSSSTSSSTSSSSKRRIRRTSDDDDDDDYDDDDYDPDDDPDNWDSEFSDDGPGVHAEEGLNAGYCHREDHHQRHEQRFDRHDDRRIDGVVEIGPLHRVETVTHTAVVFLLTPAEDPKDPDRSLVPHRLGNLLVRLSDGDTIIPLRREHPLLNDARQPEKKRKRRDQHQKQAAAHAEHDDQNADDLARVRDHADDAR